MTKYGMEDLKVGAVFKSNCTTRTIITVGKRSVFYSFIDSGIYGENSTDIINFFDGYYGDLVRPNVKTKKIAQLEAEIKKEGA